MTLNQAVKNHNARQQSLEDDFFKDLSVWIKKIKPDATSFEFDGNQESDDEGGSTYYFSSLTINGESLEESIAALPFQDLKEKLPDIFGDLEESEFNEYEDADERMEVLIDSMRDAMYGLPEFIYEHGEHKIKIK